MNHSTVTQVCSFILVSFGLLHIKSNTTHGNGRFEFFVQFLLGRVIGQINPIETGMGSGIDVRLAIDAMNGKLFDIAVIAL